ncbi:MAG: hypothetical protein LBD86_04140 [Spirochaetaceae bacterium]|jgi:hypothetical protein|nr:hypothetical protein [Spirochaetaceae bacterium]
MEIIVLDSAYKHGVSKQSIYSCLFNFRNDMTLDDNTPKRLFIGFDHLGNALEIIAVEDIERDCLVVIHAMKLRKQFYYLLDEE